MKLLPPDLVKTRDKSRLKEATPIVKVNVCIPVDGIYCLINWRGSEAEE